ncbi:MAG: serine/threonine-protein kinase [Saprospiraceae bacterium]|nr:serine/threonine-protein kinase [Saprospiraceae bacterium]MDP4913129.1 serine/threonine-protein kinase [Saprospiraceae bacterium]
MANVTLIGTNGTYIFDPENRESCLGEGGMGRVFKGEEKETGRKVAVKVLFKEFTSNENNIERFKIESTVKIRHKNLIEMIDFIEDGGKFHIISEYLEGEVLSDKLLKLIKNGQTVGVDYAKRIILGIAEGLEELHKNKIIHRDIKPSNIMLLDDGNIKLFDYGVIKKSDEVINKLTRDGSFVGSYQYASPEQIRNVDKNAINESTDVYSLGITLYELLTGQVPFDGISEWEIMEKHTKEILPTHSNINKGFYNLITNATAKEQKHRYKTITAFKDDLLKLPYGIVNLIKNEWWQTKNFKLGGAAAAIILICGVSITMVRYNSNKREYNKNFETAENFYSVARYDSAKVYYDKALEYINNDSTMNKAEALRIFIPAIKDFYQAKYNKAFEQLKKAADLGLVDANYYLGEMTFNGQGITKSYKEGFKFTNKALEGGFKMANMRIALAYEYGYGVKKDKNKADKYFLEALEGVKKLADNGDPEALGNIGYMYLNGSGIVENNKLAYEYYLKSANTGYTYSMNMIAACYLFGYGVDKNINETIKWLEKSANIGNPQAQNKLGHLFIFGDNDEIKIDVNKGVELIKKAAHQNYSPALNSLANLYFDGEYLPKDYKKHFELVNKAFKFDEGNYNAIENLGDIYQFGIGTEINYKKAEDFYQLALKTNGLRSNNYINIAKLYRKGGPGLKKNESTFVKYLIIAEKKGNMDATAMLGDYYNEVGNRYYYKGDYSTAKKYYRMAANKGDKNGKYNVRYMNKYYPYY